MRVDRHVSVGGEEGDGSGGGEETVKKLLIKLQVRRWTGAKVDEGGIGKEVGVGMRRWWNGKGLGM